MRLILLSIWFLYYKFKYISRVTIHGFAIIYAFPKSHIFMGKDVVINSSFSSNLLGLFQRVIIVARDGGQVIIGNNVGISGATIYSINKIEIGNKTLIGANSKIIDNDFHSLKIDCRQSSDRTLIKSKPIYIGDNVFIGCNSIILKGSRVGSNSIIGAGSVVSGSFPSNCIIAGNPARIIKYI